MVLEVENLQTEFHLRSANVKAVEGVSFTVAEGECVGLVGAFDALACRRERGCR